MRDLDIATTRVVVERERERERERGGKLNELRT